MSSEERVLEFFDVFPAELPELRKAFKCHLDQHAAEAKADQREMCADAVIAELKSIGFQIYESGEDRIRKACLGATVKGID